jgi:hypothetical protein
MLTRRVTAVRGAVPPLPVAVLSAGARSRRLAERLRSMRGASKPSELPPPPPLLVGREEEMLALTRYLTQPGEKPRIAVVSGASGMGKSALAIAAAHSVASYFRNGQIYIQLPWPRQSADDLRGALTRVADTMKVPADRLISAQAPGLPAAVLRERRLLVVLDGINDTFEFQAVLTPGLRACALILTSRGPLPDVGEHRNLELPPLTDDAAFGLLTSLISHARMSQDPAFIQQIITEAQGIPYAIQLAAAALKLRPGWDLGAVASRVDSVAMRTVRKPSPAKYAFDLSFALLTESQRNALLRLGSLGPGVFTARRVHAAIGIADDRSVTQSVNALARARLIERTADEDTGRAAYRITSLTSDYITSRLPSGQLIRENIPVSGSRIRQGAEEMTRSRSRLTSATYMTKEDWKRHCTPRAMPRLCSARQRPAIRTIQQRKRTACKKRTRQ